MNTEKLYPRMRLTLINWVFYPVKFTVFKETMEFDQFWPKLQFHFKHSRKCSKPSPKKSQKIVNMLC